MTNDHLLAMIRQTEALERRLAILETAEPSSRLQAVVSTFQLLPALRGFWPMSSVGDAAAAIDAVDLSGQGRHLTYAGNPKYSVDGLAPYLALDGAGDYLTRVDTGFAILGNEGYIASAIRGLTFGGWFYHDAGGANEALITRTDSGGATAIQYWLHRNTSNGLRAYFADGTTGNSLSTNNNIVPVETWYYAVGRFIPSTEICIFVNAIKTTYTTAILATLRNASSLPLNIGTYANSGNYPLAGRASLCFLCASALSDDTIGHLYEVTRPLFGV